MQNRRLIQSVVLVAALAVACLGTGAEIARADVITFDVQANMEPYADTPALCSAAGCALGGTIVVNNSAGAPNDGFVSADVTISGETPPVGPFTQESGFGGSEPPNGNTSLEIEDASAASILYLYFTTPTTGSLVGYDGGGLVGAYIETTNGVDGWANAPNSGSLTPTPEPASFLLFGTGLLALAGFFALRKNKRSAASFGVR